MNLTKLTNAEYTLQGIREALDGDAVLDPNDPTAYYTAAGNPPAYWIGKGAELVGGTVGTTASSKTVRELINERRNPENGQYLGDVKLTAGDNGAAPVAGWDFTTRQPKSISILWAFGDEETRRGIDECMRQATEMTIGYFEDEYATTRAGQGGVASVRADGVAGFVFDHYDTRDGDPQPHKHIVISNRVRRSSDKVWTALDGRKAYSSMVEISEVHENLLQDLLTERFGWSWTTRTDGDSKAVVNEVAGVPAKLIDIFSSRDAEITRELEKKIKEYEESTGKTADWKLRAEFHKEVWLATRKAKPEVQPSLAEKRSRWYRKLGDLAPDVQLEQVWKDVGSRKTDLLRVDAESEDEIAGLLLAQLADIAGMKDGDEYLEQQARVAVDETSKAHTTWKRTNVRAEAERLLRGVRLDPKQRVIIANRIADKALGQCVKLTEDRYKIDPDMADDLAVTTRNGRSAFDDADLDLYTTTDVLQAERYMIDSLGKTRNVGYAAGEGNAWLDRWNQLMRQQGGYPLAPDQQRAAAYALEDQHLVSSIIGPAGTGKTTTMKAVAAAWQELHGRGSVLGLATSRKAVGELRNSIGCESMTIAKLLTLHSPEQIQEEAQREGMLQQRLEQATNPLDRLMVRVQLAAARLKDHSADIKPNQLIIVDEAGMVDTRNLQWVTKLAETRGAKVILTGDPKQLDSVSGAGGMLGYADRHDRCERLTSLWRFTAKEEKWADDPDGPDSKRRWEGEAEATLRLRDGGDPLDEASVNKCKELVEEYARHDRIHWGEDADIEEDAYNMCVEWQGMGKTTLMIAATNKQVRDINQRFILERRAKGQSEADPEWLFPLADGLSVGVGDQIVCRRNSRMVKGPADRDIENNMTFRIIGAGEKGVRCVNLADDTEWNIPKAFLRKWCEAGYASTVHRSQGMTVDRCAALFPSEASTPCNLQYVAGTRGKEENHFLFGCKPEDQRHTDHQLTGAEEDPRKIALNAMTESLLKHPESLTATETTEREYAQRHDLKRLIREHDYAAGLIAGPHLLDMLGRTHDAKTVEKIEHSPSFEWLRGVWSRAYMTDPRKAMAIIGRDLKPKPKSLTAEKAEQAAVHAAGKLMPSPDGKTDSPTVGLDMDGDKEHIDLVEDLMEKAGIPYSEAARPDGARLEFSQEYAPAVKGLLDAHMQCRDDIDQGMFPDWMELRRAAREAVKADPDLKRKSRPVEPDWAATVAGRLNAGLLDRANGVVHDDWVGGVLPPTRSGRNDARADLVRQNERLIEEKTRDLEREARQSGQPWVAAVMRESTEDRNLLRDVAVYRAMWGVEDADSPLGERPEARSGKQEQHWTNLNGRINHTSTTVVPPKPAPTANTRHDRTQEQTHATPGIEETLTDIQATQTMADGTAQPTRHIGMDGR